MNRTLLFLACGMASFDLATQASAQMTFDAELVPSVSASGTQYGQSIAMSGSTIAVGAPRRISPPGTGAVSVFVHGTAWTEQARLTGDMGDFGTAVAMDGNTLAVGAPSEMSQGRVHVYERAGTVWSEVAVLASPSATTSALFGAALAMDGTSLVVGEPLADSAGRIDRGRAHVFVRGAAGWALQATLPSVDTTDELGSAVAIDGNTAIVGEPRGGSGTDGIVWSGQAYVFVRTGSSWARQATLEPPVALRDDDGWFGAALDVSGNVAVIAAPHDPEDTLPPPTAKAHVFVRTGALWRWAAYYSWIDNGAGRSVDLEGTLVAIGAPGENSGPVTDAGGVFLCTFTDLPGGGLSCGTLVTASPTTMDERVGISVAFDGSRIAAGALGAAYTYGLTLTLPIGAPCDRADECGSGFCTDGVCCETACGGGAGDCRACSAALTGGASGTCAPLSSTVAPTITCRASAGRCDLAEVCSTASTTCPSDARATTVCRVATGACDVPESCDGGVACPPDALATAGTACGGAVTGACSSPGTCNGRTAACPGATPRPAGTVCRARDATNPCDVDDVCDGIGDACPPRYASARTVCRAPGDEPCDAPDLCSGTSAECVPTLYVDAECRPSTGVCDPAEVCNGVAARCPPDIRMCGEPDAGVADAGIGDTDAGMDDADAGMDDRDADAGMGDTDAAIDDHDAALGEDAGERIGTRGGCACRAAPGRSSAPTFTAFALVLLILCRIRRRARGATRR